MDCRKDHRRLKGRARTKNVGFKKGKRYETTGRRREGTRGLVQGGDADRVILGLSGPRTKERPAR